MVRWAAEHREMRRKGGVAVITWVEDRAANHALDCAVYARAALKMLTRIYGARTDDNLLRRMREAKK